MDQPSVNLDLLAKHLKSEMETRGLSIRAAATEIGCSAATLARLLQGPQAPSLPDSINLMRATSWLKRNLSDFEKATDPRSSTIAEVEVHLRALPGLSGTDAEGLVAMVKAAYGAANKLRSPKSSRR